MADAASDPLRPRDGCGRGARARRRPVPRGPRARRGERPRRLVHSWRDRWGRASPPARPPAPAASTRRSPRRAPDSARASDADLPSARETLCQSVTRSRAAWRRRLEGVTRRASGGVSEVTPTSGGLHEAHRPCRRRLCSPSPQSPASPAPRALTPSTGRRRPSTRSPSRGTALSPPTPTSAVLSFGVDTRAATAKAALAANGREMRQVIAAVKAAGGRDVGTLAVSLSQMLGDNGEPNGFAASNTVTAGPTSAGQERSSTRPWRRGRTR